jgi:hypothetical protein
VDGRSGAESREGHIQRQRHLFAALALRVRKGKDGDTDVDEREEERMEQRYEFEGAEVRRLVQETQDADERLLTEAQRYLAAGVAIDGENAALMEDVDHPETGAPPGLWLMNDHGIYLRSNATDRADGSLAYARGYRDGPQVGDEAFCEFIDAGPLGQVRDGDTLAVTLDEHKVRLSLVREG